MFCAFAVFATACDDTNDAETDGGDGQADGADEDRHPNVAACYKWLESQNCNTSAAEKTVINCDSYEDYHCDMDGELACLSELFACQHGFLGSTGKTMCSQEIECG